MDAQVSDSPDDRELELQLTPLAAEMAKAAIAREGRPAAALRVAVVGGGCSGFQYSLSVTDAAAGDIVVERNGVRLFIDSASVPYLQGITIDYVAGLHAAGFKFINPNATRTCGCGSSFSA